jgi:hypothetical protein
VREPTRLTRPLQLALPVYFLAWSVIAWGQTMPALVSSVAAAQQIRATTIIITLAIWIVLAILLAYGSLRRWRWAFWGYILVLGWLAESAIQFAQTRTALDLVSDGIGVALLGIAVFALIRYGPWGMKKLESKGVGAQ